MSKTKMGSCPPGKIWNPKTRRCVNTTGSIGKKLSQSANKIQKVTRGVQSRSGTQRRQTTPRKKTKSSSSSSYNINSLYRPQLTSALKRKLTQGKVKRPLTRFDTLPDELARNIDSYFRPVWPRQVTNKEWKKAYKDITDLNRGNLDDIDNVFRPMKNLLDSERISAYLVNSLLDYDYPIEDYPGQRRETMVTNLLCNEDYRDQSLVHELLKSDLIDVNARNEAGLTPLMSAAFHCYPETIALLSAHKDIDINLQCPNGRTALMMARDHRGSVDVLLAQPKLNVFLKNNKGHTAYDSLYNSKSSGLASWEKEERSNILKKILSRERRDKLISAKTGNHDHYYPEVINSFRFGKKAKTKLKKPKAKTKLKKPNAKTKLKKPKTK